jgi:hypothetical protein
MTDCLLHRAFHSTIRAMFRFVPTSMVVAPLVLAACRTQSDAPIARDSVRDSVASGKSQRLGVFDPSATRRGDTILTLVADSIAAQRTPSGELVGIARFEGSVVLSGHTFSHPDGADYPFPCFEADTATARRLPRWAGDTRRPWFCFENRDEAKTRFGGPEPNKPATIRIDRYTIHRNLSDAVNSARLIEVELLAGSSPPSEARCYSASTSMLGRLAGSAAPAPTGVIGWLRVDPASPTGNDSGTARLADSDERSLGATWRRIGGDSIVIVGFDDFLRVEMRVAVTGDRLAGSATARSDAAISRDSTGRVTPFERRWRIDAVGQPCSKMPESRRPA